MPEQSYIVCSSPLSLQQQQIWELYEQGYGAKRIARALEISVDQVKVQLRRIKAKIEGGNKNCGQKPLRVSRAHEGLETRLKYRILARLALKAQKPEFPVMFL
ncbi:MAG: helix-turn-helix transcriptional regulator [Moorellaceae bacterium]